MPNSSKVLLIRFFQLFDMPAITCLWFSAAKEVENASHSRVNMEFVLLFDTVQLPDSMWQSASGQYMSFQLGSDLLVNGGCVWQNSTKKHEIHYHAELGTINCDDRSYIFPQELGYLQNDVCLCGQTVSWCKIIIVSLSSVDLHNLQQLRIYPIVLATQQTGW